MRVLLIGLDGALPEVLFGDERLTNLRHLMQAGCYGRLDSVIPCGTVPGWISLATSRDPGSLGVYGAEDRQDRGYATAPVRSDRCDATTLWDVVGREDGQVHLLGTPPNWPPLRTSGVSVGCYLSRETSGNRHVYPPSAGELVRQLVGDLPVDVASPSEAGLVPLRDAALTFSRQQFQLARHLLGTTDWRYLQLVDLGLRRVQTAFWQHYERDQADDPLRTVVGDYYAELDGLIGGLLEAADEQTAVVIASACGTHRARQAFCLNEWLVREGWLVPTAAGERRPLKADQIDWQQTRAWAVAGRCARLYLNVEGREPQGYVPSNQYTALRDELAAGLEAIRTPDGQSLGVCVFKPEDVYQQANGTPPDLLIGLNDPDWTITGEVGCADMIESDGGAGCDEAPRGAFILASANNPLTGEIEGASLLDLAPTILHLTGQEVPEAMQGRSLIGDEDNVSPGETRELTQEEEAELTRARLRGLGYI